MVVFYSPFCSWGRANGDNDSYGHYFVEVGAIIVQDHHLVVYEADDWMKWKNQASPRAKVNLMTASLIECRKFKSSGGNHAGVRISITESIDDSAMINNTTIISYESNFKNSRRLTILLEKEDHRKIREVLRPFMPKIKEAAPPTNCSSLDTAESDPAREDEQENSDCASASHCAGSRLSFFEQLAWTLSHLATNIIIWLLILTCRGLFRVVMRLLQLACRFWMTLLHSNRHNHHHQN